VEGNDQHGGHGRVCEGDRAHVRVSHGMVEVKSRIELFRLTDTMLIPYTDESHYSKLFLCDFAACIELSALLICQNMYNMYATRVFPSTQNTIH